MKQFFLILFLLALLSLNTVAQNYQCFRSDRISYFQTENGDIYPLKVDSTKVDQQDSILHFFKNMHIDFAYCGSTPYGPSWMGDKMIVKPNGNNLFFNFYSDSIRIKTQAKLNEEWTAFEITDSMLVTAKCIKHELESFLGLIDSVKTISFEIHNHVENTKHQWINNKQLKISKNYGVIYTWPFKDFSGVLNENYNSLEMYNMSIVGISNPKLGIQNLTWNQVFDFEIGDEFHIESGHSGGPQQSPCFSYYIESIEKVLNKTNIEDTVIYTFEVKSRETWSFCGVNYDKNDSIVTRIDTITQKIQPYPWFDDLPLQPHGWDDYQQESNSMWISTFLSKSINSSFPPLGKNGECWQMIYVDGGGANVYHKGLGGPYYDYGFMPIYKRELLYHKKGNESWGTPLVINVSTEQVEENMLQVFSIQNKQVIVCNNSKHPAKFEAFHFSGKKLLEQNLNEGTQQISIDTNSPLIIYRITQKSSLVKTGKLILK